jgi:hypothetical protein
MLFNKCETNPAAIVKGRVAEHRRFSSSSFEHLPSRKRQRGSVIERGLFIDPAKNAQTRSLPRRFRLIGTVSAVLSKARGMLRHGIPRRSWSERSNSKPMAVATCYWDFGHLEERESGTSNLPLSAGKARGTSSSYFRYPHWD